MAYTHAINGGWGYGGIAIAKNGLDGIFYIKSIMICVVLLVIFAVAVLCSKRDSIVRCITYTFMLTLLALYLIFVFLIPNLRDWHPLVPADCSIAGEPQLVAYRTSKGAVHYAHIPVNVSYILCEGVPGDEADMSNDASHRESHWPFGGDGSGQLDYAQWDMCSKGSSIVNESTGYLRLDGWYEFDPDERQDALGRYKPGLSYFCWVDPQDPDYVTFHKDHTWAGIFYPLACLVLVIFLCWSAGTFALLGSCCRCMDVDTCCDCERCWTGFDPWFLRIDAKTPASRLRQMRGGVDVL